ncbi:filamentous hemagglutinin family N-terminal domain protein [Collimonas arenae]|uniref:Filamentous hemagglutinin family N-terminal domain protein n=1 Tax=Collimonas arenae TaxID=279058 RepID=A0A127QPU2_9BURK|nr:filamentous hemagglutinin N-terminal domain-containing protein [Collimonas arenae]AMP12004.1 filamentous hemagglutinin family N-terminal domain protein [Collimonas arenae]
MNKQNFRVIFSKPRNALVVVAENISNQSKGSGSESSSSGVIHAPLMRFAHLVVAVLALFGCVSGVNAQIVANPNAAPNIRPTVTQTASGIPLVQIASPNSTGLSHNQFNSFSVGSQGAVLNNSRVVVGTQLAGQIQGNPNLSGGSANIILNEVVGGSRSQLNGYLEVAGQKAQVIISNENGITCSGCGWINTSRGVLSTGAPVFGGDGSLQAFRVTRGDIQINGLNAANTDQTDLISRSVAINGQLWANQLNVITGTNQVNFADLGVQTIQSDNNKPTVAIDVASLGGMYANKIRLVGTENGVGVRSLGGIASQAGDLSLDSQGQITLAGQTSAVGSVTIHSHDGVVNSGTVYGQQAVLVSSDNQVANSGTIASKSDLTLFAGSIASTGVLGAGIDANNQASQPGSVNLVAAGSLSATGQNVAGANVTMNGASLDISHASTSAAGNVALTARAGDINHTGGNLQAGGGASLNASGAILNDAAVINAAQLTSTSTSLSNHGGTLNQSGNGATSISTSGLLDNSSGAITTAAQNATLQVGGLSNDAGQINQTGTGTLTVNSGALSNVAGNIATGGQLAVNASSLNNQRGQVIAAGAENFQITGNVANNQGILQSGTGMTVQAGAIDNSAGRITSLDTSGLTLSTTGQLTNAAGTTAGGVAGGVIGGNGNVSVTAANASNSGQITATNNLTTNVSGLLDNSGGHLAAGQTLQANAAALKNNAGAIDAANVGLTVAQLDNSHGKVSADQLTIHSTNLTNEAGQLLQFGTGANVIDVAATLDNSAGGLIQTNSTDLTLTPQTLNNSGGTIAHAGSGTLTVNTGSGAVQNQNGSIATNGQLAVTAGSVNNQAGKLTANAGETLNVAGALNNVQGTVQAANALQVNAGSIDNSAGHMVSLDASGLTLTSTGQLTNGAAGVIGGNGNVAVSAANATNAGSITANNNLTTNVSGTFDNSGGRLAAGHALQANAGTMVNNAGVIDASTVALTIPQLNNSGGKITADQLTIHSTNLTNEAGQIAQFGTSTNVIAVANALDNSAGGVIQTNSADLTLTPQTLNNAGGTIALAGSGTLTVTAASGVLQNQQGSIGGNGLTNVSALSITNQGGSIFGQKATTIAATQGDINNSAGGYLGGSQLTVNAAGAVDNTSGKIEGTQSGLTLSANSLNNAAGTVQSLGGAPLSITAAQGISNGVANGVGGFIGSAGDVDINAGPVDNTGGTLYAKDALTLQANGQLTNSYGVIQSGSNLSATANGAVVNANGRIEANGSTATMTVSGSSLDNTSGRIANSGTGLTNINGGSQITNTNAANTPNMGTIGGNGDVALTSTNLDNSSGGQVIAAGNLTLNQGGTVNNNAGKLFAGKNLQLNQPGAAVTNVGGVVSATGNINVAVASVDNTFGLIATTAGAGGDIALSTASNFNNAAGTIASDHNLALTAPTLTGNGKVVAGQDAAISLQGDYANMATSNLLAANRDLTLSITGNLTNTGNLEAVRNLTLNAANVDNQSTGLINAGNGETVIHSSNAVTNTGRIYGGDIAIGAQTLTNDVDTTTNQAGVIASRNTLQIGAQQITNREHALIQSLSDMALGGALDANNNVTGSAASILNSSATIDSGGALFLQTASLTNQNNHFSTTQQVDPTQTTHVTEYNPWYDPTIWYTPNQVTWGDSGDGGVVLIDPMGGRYEKFSKKDYTQEVSKTVVTSSDPGKISSAGNMTLSGNVTNDKSTIIAGGTLGGTTGSINNIGATGTTDTVQHMTAGENYYHYVDGHPHQNHYDLVNNGAAYDNVLPSTPLALQVWTVQQNTQPVTGPNQAVGNGVGGNAVPTFGGLLVGANQSGLSVGAGSGKSVGSVAGGVGRLVSVVVRKPSPLAAVALAR